LVFLTTKLSDLIPADCILELETATKGEALRVLSEQVSRTDRVLDGGAFFRALMEREGQASTGVGMGIAIPHVKIPEVSDYVVAVGRSRQGIPFDALDGKPVHLVFMIGASDRQTREFVKILAQVTHLLKAEPVRESLKRAAIPDEFLSVIRENER
jgi:mannitol/fructose-specific phosphotransferase system IIA component (Ntr-type)